MTTITAAAAITTDAATHALNPAACLNYGDADHAECPSSVECHHAHDGTAAAAAGRVVRHAISGERRAADYDVLVAHYGLGADSDSATITAAARAVVVMGADASSKTRGLITVDDLTGRDPGADLTGEAKVKRDHWVAARTVRAGLVKAIKRATASTDETAPRVTGTENLLTRDGVARLATMMADGGAESVLAAVLAELDARTAADSGE